MSAPAGAEAMLLIDAESGKVLHAENSTQPWYPASVTKLMTAYVTLRAVKERRLTLDTLLPVSPNAVAQAPTKMGFFDRLKALRILRYGLTILGSIRAVSRLA